MENGNIQMMTHENIHSFQFARLLCIRVYCNSLGWLALISTDTDFSDIVLQNRQRIVVRNGCQQCKIRNCVQYITSTFWELIRQQ